MRVATAKPGVYRVDRHPGARRPPTDHRCAADRCAPVTQIRRLLLDVLKPHAPNAVEFACALAAAAEGCRVRLTTTAVDAKTESLLVVVEGDDVPFDAVQHAIEQLGASLHSIDEVDVASDADHVPV